MVRRYLYAALAIIGAVGAATLQAQEPKTRKFLKKPLVIDRSEEHTSELQSP